MSEMTPGERRELRTVVRARMKVLRADVEQRRGELIAEAEARLNERYHDQDQAIADANRRVMDVVEQARRDIRAITDELTTSRPDITIRGGRGLLADGIHAQIEDRAQLRRALISGIDAQIKSAMLDLDRQEATLLSELAIGALESDAARRFLGQIPTVGELVPSARLREIEAGFDQGGTR